MGHSPDIADAYARRAAEYAESLGSMSSVHPADVALVSSWAAGLDGRVLDAGCGPGHWTAFLAEHGTDVVGVDQVSAFIDHARAEYPAVDFREGTIDALVEADGSIAGVLAWYSLIHHEPDSIGVPLREFARVLRPSGELLIGFFAGPVVEPFDHAVMTAYRWTADALADELGAVGFEVQETHTRTVSAGRPRPHGAIRARLTR